MPSIVIRDDGAVRAITLNRPETLNALTLEAMAELGASLEAAAADAAVRAVVVTGAEVAFSSGGDTRFLHDIPAMSEAQLRDVVYGTFQRPIRALRAMEARHRRGERAGRRRRLRAGTGR